MGRGEEVHGAAVGVHEVVPIHKAWQFISSEGATAAQRPLLSVTYLAPEAGCTSDLQCNDDNPCTDDSCSATYWAIIAINN